MRKLITVSVGLLMAAGLVLAQGHENTTEREARDTIVFASSVRIGTQVLAPGEYRVACNRELISFTQTTGRKEAISVPCQGKLLAEPRKTSEVHTSTGPDGVRVIDKLLLKGSNVEHVFK